jgi:predicted transcriptional regulator
MKIGGYCNREVITAEQDISVLEAAKLMRSSHVGCLVIVNENNQPVGIVTDRDIVVEVIAEELSVDSVSIKDFMAGSPAVVREDDDINTALLIMEKHGVRRIPVLNDNTQLVGILALDDILKEITRMLGSVISSYYREFSNEKTSRK